MSSYNGSSASSPKKKKTMKKVKLKTNKSRRKKFSMGTFSRQTSSRASLFSNGRQSLVSRSSRINSIRISFTDESTILSQTESSINNGPINLNQSLESLCDGDPYWEYYRLIGDITRSNGNELILAMKWLGADNLIKIFLQNWIQSRIAPKDLPFANLMITQHTYNNNIGLYGKYKQQKKKNW